MENTQTQAITSQTKVTPAFFFLSLGVIVGLIWSVSSFLILFFETLEQKFPDALNAVYQYGYNSYNFDGIRSAMASLIIVFPIFLVISYFWRKVSSNELSKWDAVIRKWMLALVLFLASLLIIIDLVTLVRYFVSGETTLRFVLKVAGTFIVAIIAGSYYAYELKNSLFPWKNIVKLYAIKSTILVVALVVFSFMVIGSPKTQRALRFDDRRIQDLQSIQWQVITYWQQKEKLPKELNDLKNPISGFSLPVDPEVETGKVYEYKPTGNLSFELCAQFSLPIPKGWQEGGASGVYPMPISERDVASSYPYGGVNDSWDHQAGRTCFTRTIDKDLYPPYPKPLVGKE